MLFPALPAQIYRYQKMNNNVQIKVIWVIARIGRNILPGRWVYFTQFIYSATNLFTLCARVSKRLNICTDIFFFVSQGDIRIFDTVPHTDTVCNFISDN